MDKKTVGMALALAALTAAPLAAQRSGSVEVGAYAQYTQFDDELLIEDSWTYGGRLGIFIFRNLSLEGSISTGSAEGNAGMDTYRPIYGHVIYHLPIVGRTQLLLGAGYVNQGYLGDQTFNEHEDGFSGLAGLRFPLGKAFSLRVDGLYDYMPSPGPGLQVGNVDATSTNLSGRAGLSYTWRRGAGQAPPPPPVFVPAPAPPPPPAPAPTPTPPPAPAPAPDRSGEVRSMMTEMIYFDFDKQSLRDDARATLDRKIPLFQANPDMRIRISGHADERGSDEYNLALGQRRAASAKEYLVQRGINASRIDVASYGEERQVCTEKTEACYQQNRRDEFEVIAGGPSFKMP